MAYERVNAAWPEGTRDGRDLKPTAQEAVAACRRLYRFAMKRPWRKPIEVTSGNRFTWIRSGVLYVNPDLRGGGWHEIVHCMAHLCGYRLYPGADQHGPQHFWLEMQMVEHVVKSGWLDGKLRRPEKPPVDRKVLTDQKTIEGIARWKAKMRRAQKALRKLERKAKRRGLIAA